MLLGGRPPENLQHRVVDASSARKVVPEVLELVARGQPIVQEQVETLFVGGVGGELFERKAADDQFSFSPSMALRRVSATATPSSPGLRSVSVMVLCRP
jgi:hypothetical protein